MKNIFNKIKTFIIENFEDMKSFILRYSTSFILLAIVLVFFGATHREINTILLIIMWEILAIVLSSFAVFAYTNIKFTAGILKKRTMSNDFSITEKNAMINTVGYIFLGVHILVGLAVYSVYISQFA